MRKLFVGAGVVLAILGLIGLGAGLTMIRSAGRTTGPAPSGVVNVSGIKETVKIVRDPFGVPHILARRTEDAYAALGFVHAQDRMWQMDLLRRAARGRLSELFGARTIPADRLSLTLGLAHDAQAEVATLSREARLRLKAYSRGVNLWLAQLRSGEAELPYELEWLDHVPADWTIADSLAIVRLRAWNTGRSLGASLLLDTLVREIGGLPARDFFPVRPEDGAHDPLGTLLELGKAADQFAVASGMNGPVGSLGFVVSGARSATGGALLANDPHVEFGLPALFYLAHLDTGDAQVSGATWPGVPVFWAGTNGHVAWGQVALHASVSDLFDETFHAEDPHRYDRNGRWKQTSVRTAKLPVRGGLDLEIEIVRTDHGPVLRSVTPEQSRAHTLALSWTGFSSHSGIEGLLRVHRARSWEVFRSALRRIPAPAATFLYADEEGAIGTQVAGSLPVRAIETGLLPVTGGSRFYDWRGLMDFDELPSKHSSELPWLVATTHPDARDFPAGIVWLWSNPAGGRRVRHLLASSSRIDLQKIVEIQRDRSSHRGRATVHHLVDDVNPANKQAKRVRGMLLDWDGRTAADSVGASVYHVFRHRLTARLLEAKLDDDHIEQITENAGPLPGIVLARYLDRAGARRVSGVVETALEDTWRYMRTHVGSNPRKWEWGRVHRLRLQHDFERLGGGLTAWIGTRLARGPFAAPGAPDAVWTMHHRRLPTEQVGVGPALRYAVDLNDPEHALVGLAGGQSGHPGAAHYDDALGDWLAARPRPLWMHASDVAYHQAGTWELRPPGE